ELVRLVPADGADGDARPQPLGRMLGSVATRCARRRRCQCCSCMESPIAEVVMVRSERTGAAGSSAPLAPGRGPAASRLVIARGVGTGAAPGESGGAVSGPEPP